MKLWLSFTDGKKIITCGEILAIFPSQGKFEFDNFNDWFDKIEDSSQRNIIQTLYNRVLSGKKSVEDFNEEVVEILNN